MRNAVKELKLNSDSTIAMFDRATRRINVYFKGRTGKPVYRESARRGGWDIVGKLAEQNGIGVHELVEFEPSVYGNRVSFVWPKNNENDGGAE